MTQLLYEDAKTYSGKLFLVSDVIPDGMDVTQKLDHRPPCAEDNKTGDRLSKDFNNLVVNSVFYRGFRQKCYLGNFLNAAALIARLCVGPAFKSVNKWHNANGKTSTLQSKQPAYMRMRITVNNPEESLHKKWLLAHINNNYCIMYNVQYV
ncbi:hypothetical protein T4B_915 [Trichinella pseudospiralis]|uniref:Uncharacterized protein n=1 Tax=Trichinella pseudospiralis TaxID=6337 RepID=A0A0V1JE91_TRIPS|nr:hypothetical protein T4E_10844 [Trichinella pseudospiralis]KRY77571.1 hypothetical protein T4A_10125 [Trichinella pseudospiralis]KRZ33262.1 hypothetical protein T4B_915 [Trichinella pseudospiralis]